MATSREALKLFGQPGGPNEGSYMSIWNVPEEIQKAFSHVKFSALGTVGFPKKIYANDKLIPILNQALNNVIERGFTKDLKTWDGCYIVRNKRTNSSYSMHSWGLAIDVNAFENRQGQLPKISAQFASCFIDAGFTWGGLWSGKTVDGMHFEITKL